MCRPNLKSVTFPVPEIIGCTQKNWAVPGYAHDSFSPKFSWAIIRMDTVIVLAKFEVFSVTRSRDNSDWNFWMGCESPILEKGGVEGG